MCLNSIKIPENQTTVEARTTPTTCETPRDVSSARDEYTLKVRKPYTITKQRERWTDEEHNKFLEAIKLYGRAWRRIEDHIRTKTTVQIRSHAQKFFSKVVRGSADNDEGSIKPIEIPPPRPKRKPKHPYPRKLGRKPNGKLPILEKLERSLSVVRSEQENRSPKSVLSVFSSDVVGSLASDALNHCVSSDSSTSGSNQTELEFTEQEHGSNSHVTSAGEEKETPMAAEVMSDMKLDHVPTITSFQLFGKKIVISSATESTPECPKVSKFTDNKPQQNKEQVVVVADIEKPVLETQEDLCGASCKDSWGAWSCGAPQTLHRFPSQQELIDAAARATEKTQPLLVFYSGVQLTIDDKQMMHEDSWTGSDTEKSGDAVEANLLQSRRSSNDSKSELHEQARGFVPYKRRLAEREAWQKSKNPEEAESHRIKFCL